MYKPRQFSYLSSEETYDGQYLFNFTWEFCQFTWTVIPQEYTESPTNFSDTKSWFKWCLFYSRLHSNIDLLFMFFYVLGHY